MPSFSETPYSCRNTWTACRCLYRRYVCISAPETVSYTHLDVYKRQLFDFTGSSPQTKGPINCVKASTLSTIEYAVKVVTGGDSIPTNDGCFRMIQSILPEGSIVNAVKPAPTGSRGLTVQPVSYTHLDVYKRQHHSSDRPYGWNHFHCKWSAAAETKIRN